MIIRSYVANYVKFLKQEANPQSEEFYLSQAKDIASMSLCFKTYTKKLMTQLIQCCTKYFHCTEKTQINSFTALQIILEKSKDE